MKELDDLAIEYAKGFDCGTQPGYEQAVRSEAFADGWKARGERDASFALKSAVNIARQIHEGDG